MSHAFAPSVSQSVSQSHKVTVFLSVRLCSLIEKILRQTPLWEELVKPDYSEGGLGRELSSQRWKRMICLCGGGYVVSRKRAWGPGLLCLRNRSVLGVAGEAEAVFSNGRRCICVGGSQVIRSMLCSHIAGEIIRFISENFLEGWIKLESLIGIHF